MEEEAILAPKVLMASLEIGCQASEHREYADRAQQYSPQTQPDEQQRSTVRNSCRTKCPRGGPCCLITLSFLVFYIIGAVMHTMNDDESTFGFGAFLAIVSLLGLLFSGVTTCAMCIYDHCCWRVRTNEYSVN